MYLKSNNKYGTCILQKNIRPEGVVVTGRGVQVCKTRSVGMGGDGWELERIGYSKNVQIVVCRYLQRFVGVWPKFSFFANFRMNKKINPPVQEGVH